MKIVRPVTVTDAVLTSSTVTEPETLWNSGTTYGAGAAVYRVIDNVHQRFLSLQAGNLNKIPEAASSSAWWQATGATNRWACFDATFGSITTRADSIGMVLTLPASERATTLYLGAVSASTVRVQVSDPLAGAVYDVTRSLVDPLGVTDWWLYFMEPVTRVDELLVADLPPGAGSILTLTLTDTGATVELGNLVLGVAQALGVTRWEANLGIRDYSVKAEDDFGNQFIQERAFRKTTGFNVIVDNRLIESVRGTLNASRASLRLYIGDENYPSTVILGFFRNYALTLGPGGRSFMSIDLESITQ